MLITPEIDLTPESASSLAAFERLFWGGRFMLLANAATLAQTDIQTLYRAMDTVVRRAALSSLCSSPDPLTPAERLEAAKAAAEELRAMAGQLQGQVLEWFASQPAEVQAAVLALVVNLRLWAVSVYEGATPEAQAVLASLKSLLTVLAGEMASLRPQQAHNGKPVNGQA